MQTAVNSLESKLINLKRFLPKPERRRGLLNVGGSILKLIFGTATVADLADLHTSVDALKQKQGEVLHALNQQLTYLKQMDSTVKLDHEVIANLSYIVKDFATKLQEKFQKAVSRLEWAVKPQQATTAVRELVFTFVQFQMQLDELSGSFQSLTAGKMPVNFITFNTFYDILNNVTLSLPEGYEFAVGTQYYSLPWYVKHAHAALLADLNNFMIIMYFPLTTVNRKYELYQMFAFPSRILNSTYASFQLDGNYLAISVLQQIYVSLTASDLSRCEGNMVKICPVNRAVSSTRSDICELGLYFQRQNVREVCYRTISARMPSPTLQRQGSVVVYYLPEARNAYFRCRDSQGWKSTNLMLDGAGTLLGIQS